MKIFTTLILFLTSLSILTQAQENSNKLTYKVETLLNLKTTVWGFDFLSDGKILFTQKNGEIKIFDPLKKTISNVAGVPKVWTQGQGGLLDIRIHPKVSNRIYISYSEPQNNEASTSVMMATLENNTLTKTKKIFTGHNLNDETVHFGSRLEFDDQGHLFISLGDRNERDNAQLLNFHHGKILRINDDGSIPSDNPFIKNSKAKPEIWSYGHRNPQGLVRDPQTGNLWSTEFGPRGGDELNLIVPGANYGWPIITYGREYYGPKIGEGTHKNGMEQPVEKWVPSISPSGMTIYNGNQFPEWKGNLFLATLSGSHLRRIVLEGKKVTQQEELLKDLNLRIRNVRTGPDGYLYLSTDSGQISRLVPQK